MPASANSVPLTRPPSRDFCSDLRDIKERLRAIAIEYKAAVKIPYPAAINNSWAVPAALRRAELALTAAINIIECRRS